MEITKSLTSRQARKKFDHIKHLYDVNPESTVDAGTFLRAIDWYELTTAEARCQYLINGIKCNQEHKKGFVVENKDGMMVAIGCCCAEKRLGLEHKEAKSNFHTVKVHARQKERSLKAEEIQQTKGELLQHIKTLSKELTRQKRILSSFEQSINPALFSELVSRSKSGKNEIIWKYQITEKYIDDDGQKRINNKWYPKTMGIISGLDIWYSGGLEQIRKELNNFYELLDAIPNKTKLSEDEISTSLYAFTQFNSIKRLETELAKNSKLQAKFFEPENLKMLPLIVRNHRARPEILEQVAELIKEPLSRPAKDIIRELDKEFVSSNNASGMSIAI